jgi:outer membrane receptor for ferric coprogen and ferric-rhodotorulic acid
MDQAPCRVKSDRLLGIKGEPGRRLNTAFAIFKVTRSGQATWDPAYPFTPGERGTYCCYVANSRVTSKGFDAEVSGTVLPGLQLFAGYTFNTFETEGSPWGTANGATPKHLFKAWGTWQLPGALSAWTINAGASIQSRTSYRGQIYRDGEYQDYSFVQSGMAIWNAALQYRISDTWSVGLYGENLGDKRYYTSLGGVDYENNYAAPRNYTLSLRGNW